MALATKCPHCNTVFRVAHDQLKLRGGIVRCGSCNEVFDGNAALLEPPSAAPAAALAPLPSPLPSPLPDTTPFDQKMAALDTRAATTLAPDADAPLLQFDETEPAPDAGDDDDDGTPAAATVAADTDLDDLDDLDDPDDEPPSAAPAEAPFPLPSAPAALPPNTDALFDLDLDIESEPDLEASSEPEVAPVPASDIQLDTIDNLSEDELEAALEAELEAMEQTLADVQHDADGIPLGEDAYAGMSGGRLEPTWGDDAPLDEPQAGAGPGLSSALAAADAAISAAEAEAEDRAAARAAGQDAELAAGLGAEFDAEFDFAADTGRDTYPDAARDAESTPAGQATANPPPRSPAVARSIDDDLASFTFEPDDARDIDTVEPLPSRPLRDDELEEADEEALVQLSSAGLAEAQAARAHAFLRAQEPPEEEDEQEEPGFVKRDRQRRKAGKAAAITMGIGSLLLVGALFAQGVTTFRNTLAAALPPLKPALTSACQALGCKIELPTQIDELSIEQGELQTLSETTFSFTTLLRNQSATAQAWPSIELLLDDDKDKHVLRRVFTPRDYLSADVAQDKGFAPHTEQTVKLYFELHDLKASGYHIAVFYP